MTLPDADREVQPGFFEECLAMIREEPGLGWFFSQALFLAQPVLESFWDAESIERFAFGLQAPADAGRKEADR